MAVGMEVVIGRRDGTTFGAHLALPPDAGVHPGVVVIHEIFGLNDDIRRIAQRFAASGYVALAPDLYDGRGLRPVCIARTVLALRARTGAPFDDIDAARGFLAARGEVDGQRLGIVGFCMGGGFAVLAALRGPYRVSAPYYGEVPRQVAELEGICPVVAGFGGRDRLFAPHGARLARHLASLGVPHDVKVYPDVGHSYMNRHPPTLIECLGAWSPMRVGYDEAAAEDSWKRMLAFFARHL